MKITPFLLALGTILLISCEKNSTETTKQLPSDEIIIGQTQGMKITSIDTTFRGGGSAGVVGYHVDVNGDGIGDIKFSSAMPGSMGIGYRPISWVTCVQPDAELFGKIEDDTTFKKREIVVLQDTSIPVTILEHLYFSCSKLDADYKVASIKKDTFKIKASDVGDKFSKADYSLSTELTIAESGSFLRRNGSLYRDTIVVAGDTKFYSHCYSFSGGKTGYVGVKLKRGGVTKLGWVKISVSENYIITVHEAAIQK